MSKRWIVAMVVLLAARVAQGQSLGEVAEKDKERRAKAQASGAQARTLTDDDLKKKTGGSGTYNVVSTPRPADDAPGPAVRWPVTMKLAGTLFTSHTAEKQAYVVSVAGLLRRGSYAELEEMAATLRKSRPRFSSGLPKLYAFYSALTAEGSGLPANEYDERIRSWILERGRSVTPRIARAKTVMDAGWKARGARLAKDVAAAAFAELEKRAEEAWRICQEAKGLPDRDVELYGEMIRICTARECSRAEVEGIFREGLKIDPLYDDLYLHMAHYLLPKWNGKPGDVEKLAESARATRPGKEGAILSARVAAEVLMDEGTQRYLAGYHFLWDDVRPGLQALIETYPSTSWTRHVAARLSCAHGRALPPAVVFAMKNAWDEDGEKVWKDKDRFDTCMNGYVLTGMPWDTVSYGAKN
jgi:hypothetical protein